MAELLIEILSEEIPASMQEPAARNLERLIIEGLKSEDIDFDQTEYFFTPRRIGLFISGLPKKSPDIVEEKRGPRVDSKEQAVDGFLRSTGTSIDKLIKRETPKGEFYFYTLEKKGNKTEKLLKPIIEKSMTSIQWPKSMKWGSEKQRWIRPIVSILSIFDQKVIPVTYASCLANNITMPHAFLTDTVLEVESFSQYKKSLDTGHVVLKIEDRIAIIEKGAEAIASGLKLSVRQDDQLIKEVAGLVEWPVPLLGQIDKIFMDVPHEILETTMRKNQKYFSLEDSEGKLAPYFIVVANKETPDGGAAIVAGNERVLRSRLADAKFFWERDLTTSLEEKSKKLDSIIFHAELGSVLDKTKRLQTISAFVAEELKFEKEETHRAASLCKADLVTGLVIEFPELQGIIGGYCATNDGERPEVSKAISEHYSPIGPFDICPTQPASMVVSIADKVDNLASFFSINMKPTGSKDPFALRRSALGVIRIILENKLQLDLRKLFVNLLPELWSVDSVDQMSDDILDFFIDRFRVFLLDQGGQHDLISAVLSSQDEVDLVKMSMKLNALTAFLDSSVGRDLLIVFKRANNILRIEQGKDNKVYNDPDKVDKRLLEEASEVQLFNEFISISPQIRQALENSNYEKALDILASMRQKIDDFFMEVKVNAGAAKLRQNRLYLLGIICSIFNEIADFSKIEGGKFD